MEILLDRGADGNPYYLKAPNGGYIKPIDMIDAAAQIHDYRYNQAKTGGISGAFFNLAVRRADLELAVSANIVITFAALGIKDPVSHKYVTEAELRWAVGITSLFGSIASAKYIRSTYEK